MSLGFFAIKPVSYCAGCRHAQNPTSYPTARREAPITLPCGGTQGFALAKSISAPHRREPRPGLRVLFSDVIPMRNQTHATVVDLFSGGGNACVSTSSAGQRRSAS